MEDGDCRCCWTRCNRSDSFLERGSVVAMPGDVCGTTRRNCGVREGWGRSSTYPTLVVEDGVGGIDRGSQEPQRKTVQFALLPPPQPRNDQGQNGMRMALARGPARR